MPRARTATVPCPPPSDQAPFLNRRLRHWLDHRLRTLQPILQHSSDACQADRYRKHFPAVGHGILLLFHGLSRSPSLRQSYASFGGCRDVHQRSGLAASTDPDDERLAVSYSQLADSSHTRPAAFLAGLLPSLVAEVQALGRSAGTAIPANVHAFDATFLRLTIRLSSWLPSSGKADIPGQLAFPGWSTGLHPPT